MPPECVESAPPGEVEHGVSVIDVYSAQRCLLYCPSHFNGSF